MDRVLEEIKTVLNALLKQFEQPPNLKRLLFRLAMKRR